MSKDPRVCLAQILTCIEKIERYTVDGKERFVRDEMIQDAVVRNLEIIGEAAKQVDQSYRASHPEIPWRALAGLRDVLIHQYEGVDLERIWAMIASDLVSLRSTVGRLLPPLRQLEQELAHDDEPLPGTQSRDE